jgi:ribosome maturation factor RimP
MSWSSRLAVSTAGRLRAVSSERHFTPEEDSQVQVVTHESERIERKIQALFDDA